MKNKLGIAGISGQLIDDTINTFQPYYKEQLTTDDALEIIHSLREYSSVMLEIARDVKKRANSQNQA